MLAVRAILGVCLLRIMVAFKLLLVVTNNLLSTRDKYIISGSAEGQCVDWSSALHGSLTTTHSLLLSKVPHHDTSREERVW